MAKSMHDVSDPRNAAILINVNGELKPRAEAVVSVFDSGFMLGDGVWEGLARPSRRLRRGQRLGPVELLEPLGEGFLATFLERHGEGLHHLMLDSDPERLRLPVLMQGRVGPSAEYVYFDATEPLKLTLEAMRGSVEPTRIWP
jgi:hypothetical protein